MRRLSPRKRDRKSRLWSRAAGVALSVCAASAVLQGCGEGEREGSAPDEGAEAGNAAVEIWAHPDTMGIDVYTPLDFKAASRNVVWAIDRFAAGVLRYDPSNGEYGIIGLQDRPPAEIVSPARLAIAQDAGFFVFDDSTGMVDLYSPGGQHLRGFDPGLRPSILEVSRDPLRLTYGVRTFSGSDTIPTLSVIQSDFLGQHRDTLLSPEVGPESLRHLKALRRNVVVTPAMSGLWAFATAMSDTVFEVTSSTPERKLVLPETDSMRIGVIADLQQQILWVLSPRPLGGLDYEAFDISGQGDGGIIDGRSAYLGARTTPVGFSAQAAFDGTVSGWWRGERRVFAPMGFDMRVDALRERVETARAERDSRRAAIASDWQRLVAAADSAMKAAREEEQQIREEEGLEPPQE
jgi:hypothetical protein